MKHPDQHEEDQVHEIHKPQGHGLLDSRRDLHNRSPHAANTPIVSGSGASVSPDAAQTQFAPIQSQNF